MQRRGFERQARGERTKPHQQTTNPAVLQTLWLANPCILQAPFLKPPAAMGCIASAQLSLTVRMTCSLATSAENPKHS